MPLDPLSLLVVIDQGGPLRVVLDDGRVVPARHAEERETAPVVRGHTSHFATCSKADAFRKAK